MKAFREEEPFDINRASTADDRDANSTVTWSDIQAEKKSSRRNLKSPEKEKVCFALLKFRDHASSFSFPLFPLVGA